MREAAAPDSGREQVPTAPAALGCLSPLITLSVWSIVLAGGGAMLFSELWAFASPEVRPGPRALLAFCHMLISSFWVFAGAVAFIAAAGAFLLRRWRAGVVAAVFTVWGVAPWTVTLLRPDATTPVSDANAITSELTLLSVNPQHDRADLAAVRSFADEIAADVVALQEVSPGVATQLQIIFGDAYPHIALTEELGTWGNATLSRWPFAGDGHRPWQELPVDATGDVPTWFNYFPAVRATVESPAGPVDVVNVHPPPPMNPGAVFMQDAVMRGVISGLGHDPSQRPVVVLGDFNCTHRGVICRLMSHAGFIEAHGEIGRGLGATWPEGRLPSVPPVVRIDHVYAREGARGQIAFIATGVGPAVGSDHRPVWARLRIVAEADPGAD